jgi:hypothetical protein
MMISVHAGIHDARLDPTCDHESRRHAGVVGRSTDVRHLGFPKFLVGDVRETGVRE